MRSTRAGRDRKAWHREKNGDCPCLQGEMRAGGLRSRAAVRAQPLSAAGEAEQVPCRDAAAFLGKGAGHWETLCFGKQHTTSKNDSWSRRGNLENKRFPAGVAYRDDESVRWAVRDAFLDPLNASCRYPDVVDGSGIVPRWDLSPFFCICTAPGPFFTLQRSSPPPPAPVRREQMLACGFQLWRSDI